MKMCTLRSYVILCCNINPTLLTYVIFSFLLKKLKIIIFFVITSCNEVDAGHQTPQLEKLYYKIKRHISLKQLKSSQYLCKIFEKAVNNTLRYILNLKLIAMI